MTGVGLWINGWAYKKMILEKNINQKPFCVKDGIFFRHADRLVISSKTCLFRILTTALFWQVKLDVIPSKCNESNVRLRRKVPLVSLWHWPLTSDLKTFSAMVTHMMMTYAKFHWNPSSSKIHISSRGIGVNRLTTLRQRKDGRPDGRPENINLLPIIVGSYSRFCILKRLELESRFLLISCVVWYKNAFAHKIGLVALPCHAVRHVYVIYSMWLLQLDGIWWMWVI